MISTIKLKSYSNVKKEKQIVGLLKPWQNTTSSFIKTFKKQTYNGETIPKQAKTKTEDLEFTTLLNARQVKSAYNQALGSYNSYLTNKQNSIRQTITNSQLNNDVKTTLYRINAQKAWFIKNFELNWVIDTQTGELKIPTKSDYKNNNIIIESLLVNDDLMKLARHIFKYDKVSLPNLKKSRTLVMDGIIAQRSENNKTKTFDYWLKITTLNKGKPVNIPFKTNQYFEKRVKKAIKFNNAIQINIGEDNKVKYGFILEDENALKRNNDNVLAVDSNFNKSNLFSDNLGRLFGGKFVEWIIDMDDRLTKRLKYLQSNNLSIKNDDVYNGLLKRIRDYSKNEIHRIVNRLIIDKDDVSLLVFESLDFRGGGLSKRMNRLLSRMGRRVLRVKLDRVGDSHGVSVLKVNASYTSQSCSNCKYLSKSNRRNQLFVCGCCGKKVHADTNSPRNILDRRSIKNEDVFKGLNKYKIRDRLLAEHGSVCAFHARSLNRVAGTDDLL